MMYGRGQLPLRVASHSRLRLEREASEVCGSQRGWGIETGPGGGRVGLPKSIEAKAERLAQPTARIMPTNTSSWGISALPGASAAVVISPPCRCYFQHVPAPSCPASPAERQWPEAARPQGSGNPPEDTGLGVSLKPCALNPQDGACQLVPNHLPTGFKSAKHRHLHADKPRPASSLATEGAKTSPGV